MLKFSIDDQVTNKIVPPTGGFWELGKFQGLNNQWDSSGGAYQEATKIERIHFPENVNQSPVVGRFFLGKSG